MMLEEYDVEPERLKKDMEKLLDSLVEEGLVSLSPEKGAGK